MSGNNWLQATISRIREIADDPTLCRKAEEATSSSGWAISPILGSILERIVAAFDVHRVLEFGAGASSTLLAAALERRGGGRLISVEQDPDWCSEQWTRVSETRRVESTLLIDTPAWCIGRRGVYMGYKEAEQQLAGEAPFDLVLVDGPQGYYGRDGSLHIAAQLVKRGSLIVLDDAQRKAEKATLARVLRAYPGLHLCWVDTRGNGSRAAILVSDGLLRTRLDVRAYGAGLFWAARLERSRRRRRSAGRMS